MYVSGMAIINPWPIYPNSTVLKGRIHNWVYIITNSNPLVNGTTVLLAIRSVDSIEKDYNALPEYT